MDNLYKFIYNKNLSNIKCDCLILIIKFTQKKIITTQPEKIKDDIIYIRTIKSYSNLS
ncbi:hypothetical protein RCH18_001826 [Flavobacterium sp. PL11]|nr:hypothetical protein [Flavobacterium sp. PL11]